MKLLLLTVLAVVLAGCFFFAPRETCTAHKYINIESGTVIYCEDEDSTPGLTEWTYEGGGHSWWCDEVKSQCALN